MPYFLASGFPTFLVLLVGTSLFLSTLLFYFIFSSVLIITEDSFFIFFIFISFLFLFISSSPSLSLSHPLFSLSSTQNTNYILIDRSRSSSSSSSCLSPARLLRHLFSFLSLSFSHSLFLIYLPFSRVRLFTSYFFPFPPINNNRSC